MQSKLELVGAASAAERGEAEARYAAAAAAAAASGAPAPFRGPAADSELGEQFIDAIGIVAAVGYACEARHCVFLCGVTYRGGNKGATNDMLVRSLELQCGASAARAAKREDIADPARGWITIRGTTQMMRAAMSNDLPRVLRLMHLGAPLDLVDGSRGLSALHWACELGHGHIAQALLDGIFGRGSGSGASINLQTAGFGATPLGLASQFGREDIVRLLLARGARQELQTHDGHTALHCAVIFAHFGVVEQLCSAPGAIVALKAERRHDGRTPRWIAVYRSKWNENHERLVDILSAHEQRLEAFHGAVDRAS